MEKVSIIIPFYNCPFIDRAINSALKQTYQNIEVIVVNDGSTLYKEKILPYKHLIRYVEKKNGGTATALNLGIQHATGDYFTWLSSDDLYDPQKVEKQLGFMKKNQAMASYMSFYLINPTDELIGGPTGIHPSGKRQFCKRMLRWNFINGCTVMLKMELLRDVGIFNESLKYAHDYDLWMRILLKKYEFYYIDEPLVKYRVHEQMGSQRFPSQISKEVAAVKRQYRMSFLNMIKNQL